MGQDGHDFWERARKSTGILGGFAVLLVIFSSRANGAFDWTVFGLSGLALLLAWSQSWMLVPTHLRHKDAEDREWQRYIETDWRFVDSLSGLSGQKIDELRSIFRTGSDTKARAFVSREFPTYSPEDIADFVRFFNDTFMDTVSAYVDEDGRLRPID